MKDIMKNDKVVEDLEFILADHGVRDALFSSSFWHLIDELKAYIGENYTPKTDGSQMASKSEPSSKTKENELPTTDIDEVRRRLTWAMGVQGSPVGMLGDYEIDWIMQFFLPYLKGGE